MNIIPGCDSFLNQLVLKYFAIDADDGLRKAAKFDNKELAELFINDGADSFNWPMYYSAFNGNLELVQLFVKKGAWDYDFGMYCAFKGGHSNIVKFFEDKWAKSWNYDIFKKEWQSMNFSIALLYE